MNDTAGLSATLDRSAIRVAVDAGGVIVYQAFNPSLAAAAVAAQRFEPNGGFRLHRMTWLKTSLGWMLHRSGYAGRQDQERILRIRLDPLAFERFLGEARPAVRRDRHIGPPPDVLFQWDPDRDTLLQPNGLRTLRLGLRGSALRHYAANAIRSIEDATDEVLALRSCRRPLPSEPPFTS